MYTLENFGGCTDFKKLSEIIQILNYLFIKFIIYYYIC